MSPTVAVRLGKLFGDGGGVWTRMQAVYYTGSPHRLPGTLGPGLIKVITTNLVLAQRREDLACAGESLGVDVSGRIP